jgi:hypothetical protein
MLRDRVAYFVKEALPAYERTAMYGDDWLEEAGVLDYWLETEMRGVSLIPGGGLRAIPRAVVVLLETGGPGTYLRWPGGDFLEVSCAYGADSWTGTGFRHEFPALFEWFEWYWDLLAEELPNA